MDLRNGFDVVETPVIDDGYLAPLPPTIDRFSLMAQPEPHLPQLEQLVYDE